MKVNTIDLLLVKFDVSSQKIGKIDKANITVIDGIKISCEVCGVQGHKTITHQVRMLYSQDDYMVNVVATSNFYEYPKKGKF